jgi:ABC-type sugar transport system ATPase subunit
MRDGETIENAAIDGLSRDWLIERMVGHSFSEEFPARSGSARDDGFEVRHVSGSGVLDVSFSAKNGEVLGVAGLVGAGRTELARLIFGADRRQSGELSVNGKRVDVRSPHDAIREGIGLLTEDRKSQGLVLSATAQFNFALGNLHRWSWLGWIDQHRESQRFDARARMLNMRISGSQQLAAQLSGGNQQKLLVARWLETECRVLIFDEPTRGIDVGAKREMYFLIRQLADEGKIIIVISSEFPELLGLCDRILVMKRGQIAGVIDDVTAATQESIMAMAV